MIFLSFLNLELSQTAESSRLACSETCTSLQLLVMERGKKNRGACLEGMYKLEGNTDGLLTAQLSHPSVTLPRSVCLPKLIGHLLVRG